MLPVSQLTPFDVLKAIWTLQLDTGRERFCISTSTKKSKKDTNVNWRDFLIPIDRADILIKNLRTRNVNIYFSPLAFRPAAVRRLTENAMPSRILYADLDPVNPRTLNNPPHIAWMTSPGRYAGVWILKEKLPINELMEINKRLTYQIGADKGGWDAVQVLRVPKTRNYTQPSYPQGRMLWLRTSKPYSPEELFNREPPEDIKRLLAEGSVISPGDRSKLMWRIERGLADAGWTEEEIFQTIAPLPWQKFHSRPNQLKAEIKKACEGRKTPTPSAIQSWLTAMDVGDATVEKIDFL